MKFEKKEKSALKTIRFPISLVARLERASAQHNVSFSEFVRAAASECSNKVLRKGA